MSASADNLHELIVYAEPGGLLGARCAEFWAAASAAEASTRAQEYPPHVSLTGFFRRRAEQVDSVSAALRAACDVAAPPGLDGTRWVAPAALEFQANDEWIGLHVDAPWMDALIAAFVDDPRLTRAAPDDDAIRAKSWLHLSLSYGEQYAGALPTASELAHPFAELASESEWTVGLWRRTPDSWSRLVAVPVTGGAAP